jgi:hypothetical protein
MGRHQVKTRVVFLLTLIDDFIHHREGIYVRLTGFLKAFGGKKYINATYMRPVTDFSEVDFHFLECITVTLTLERGPVRGFSRSVLYYKRR